MPTAARKLLLKMGGARYGPQTTLTLQPDAAAGKDDRVNPAGPTLNYGLNNYLASSVNYKGLLEFDLSSIPAGSKIISAKFYLYQALSGAALAFTATIYSIAVGNAAWVEGTKNGAQAGAGEPCWNALAADGAGGVTTAWAGSAGLSTAGTDYEATAMGAFNGDRSDADGTEYSVALPTARVEGWCGATNTNYGLLITLSQACGGLGSSDHATAGYRPKLVVVYRPKN